MHRFARFWPAWGQIALVFAAAFVLTLILMIPVVVLAAIHLPAGSDEGRISALWNDPLFYYGSTIAQAVGFIAASVLIHRRGGNREWPMGAAEGVHSVAGFVKGSLLGLLLLLTVLLVMSGSGAVAGFHRTAEFSWGAIGWHALLLGLVTVNEEVFLQGFTQGVLRHRVGLAASILGPALLFTLMHGLNPGAYGQGGLPLWNTALFGVLLALCRERTGSLWMPIGLHGTWYAGQGAVFGFPISGTPVPSIWVPELGASPLLSGGSFGAEGSVFVSGLLAIGILLTLWRRRRVDGVSRPDPAQPAGQFSQEDAGKM
ncbi:CPBP family intramembrane glutamic endopeptidase [Paenibacillus sp. HJGM_3]|uniref:CPBP family intramembrane glutamic endopeptidase n=1 Tax=Paenibacillus sp. HJGM_3 TaxID=3379816 RepID=UPI00385F6923